MFLYLSKNRTLIEDTDLTVFADQADEYGFFFLFEFNTDKTPTTWSLSDKTNQYRLCEIKIHTITIGIKTA
jgi:hypothetical protein